MLAPEYERLEDYEFDKELVNAKAEAWGEIANQLTSFASLLENFRQTSITGTTVFDKKLVNTSNESVLTAVASNKASAGTYSIQVDQIAQSQVVYGYKEPDLSSLPSGTLNLNGATINVSSTDTIEDIVHSINNATGYDQNQEIKALLIDDRLVLETLSGNGHLIYGSDGAFSSNPILETLGILDTSTSSNSSAIYSDSHTDFTTIDSGQFTLNGATLTFDSGASLEEISLAINKSSDYTLGEEVIASVIKNSAGDERLALHTVDSSVSVNIADDGGAYNFITGIDLVTHTGYGVRSGSLAQTSQSLNATINGVPIENEKSDVTGLINHLTFAFIRLEQPLFPFNMIMMKW